MTPVNTGETTYVEQVSEETRVQETSYALDKADEEWKDGEGEDNGPVTRLQPTVIPVFCKPFCIYATDEVEIGKDENHTAELITAGTRIQESL